MSIESHELALYIVNKRENEVLGLRLASTKDPVVRTQNYMNMVTRGAQEYINAFQVQGTPPIYVFSMEDLCACMLEVAEEYATRNGNNEPD